LHQLVGFIHRLETCALPQEHWSKTIPSLPNFASNPLSWALLIPPAPQPIRINPTGATPAIHSGELQRQGDLPT
jgi:hypothetical protein